MLCRVQSLAGRQTGGGGREREREREREGEWREKGEGACRLITH